VLLRDRAVAALALLIVTSCHGGGAPPAPPPSTADPPSDPQRPPRGRAALEAWLAEGHFQAWSCEPSISPPRLTGSHGRNRICSNDALRTADATGGAYPVGAASVKLLFNPDGSDNGFAVGIKIDAGDGPQTWYWYERHTNDPAQPALAEGVAVPDCAVCHGMAPHDFVFFRAP
jgi:hypothetical protein